MGYGKQLLLHADRICRQHGIVRPVLCTDPENTASQKTALSCGYIFAGEVNFRGERRILRYIANE
jgi:predicted acetyltransferase